MFSGVSGSKISLLSTAKSKEPQEIPVLPDYASSLDDEANDDAAQVADMLLFMDGSSMDRPHNPSLETMDDDTIVLNSKHISLISVPRELLVETSPDSELEALG